MENIEHKKKFLREEYIPLLRQLKPDTERRWGKMNVHQMIEHMSDYVRVSSGRNPLGIVTPEEHLPKYKEFMKSEKPFKENTPNSLLPDEPNPVKFEDINEATKELKEEIDYFFEAFEDNPSLTTTHPFFGELNFEENVHLLHKHAMHHLRQFGVE